MLSRKLSRASISLSIWSAMDFSRLVSRSLGPTPLVEGASPEITFIHSSAAEMDLSVMSVMFVAPIVTARASGLSFLPPHFAQAFADIYRSISLRT